MVEIAVAGHFYLFAVPYEPTNYTSHAGDLADCTQYREIIVDEGDLGVFIDHEKTGAYFCSTNTAMGNLIVSRKRAESTDEYTFTVTNPSGTFNKVVKTTKLSVNIAGIDTETHGVTFKVLLEAPPACSMQGVEATFEMSKTSTSAAFITQSNGAGCGEDGADMTITAVPYHYTSFEWFNSSGTSLGKNNAISGKFKAGEVLTLVIEFATVESAGNDSACNPWRIDYIVKGGSVDYFWKVQSQDNNWNNKNNWTLEDGSTPIDLPGVCSSVYIPSVSSKFPDLKDATPQAIATNIHFEFGAQLYSQQNLMYENAFIQYDFAYYDALTEPAPTTLEQPNKTSNS